MGKKDRPSIKDRGTYEALRDKGYSKEKSARIANAQASDNRNPSRKGGKAPRYEEWTKDALYLRAKELDIDGCSSMTRSNLISALRDE